MQLKEYSVLTHCLKEVTVQLNFESCTQIFFTMKYRICLLFVVGVVFYCMESNYKLSFQQFSKIHVFDSSQNILKQ